MTEKPINEMSDEEFVEHMLSRMRLSNANKEHWVSLLQSYKEAGMDDEDARATLVNFVIGKGGEI